MSETAKHRDRTDVQLACKGTVLDLGSSGDPVVPWAIQLDLPDARYTEYRRDRDLPIGLLRELSGCFNLSTSGSADILKRNLRDTAPGLLEIVGKLAGSIHIRGDALDLPFKDGTVDTVQASHLLEDYADWWPALREWDRVLKVGGFLIIAVPDNERFRARVAAGQGDNLSHKHEGRVGELTEYLHGSYAVFADELVNAADYSILFIGRKRQSLPETPPVPTLKYNVPWLKADGSRA